MGFIQKFFTGFQGYTNGETRVGELNRIWYDSVTNTIRIGDGSPGGRLVAGAIAFEGEAPQNDPSNGTMWWNTVDGKLYIYFNGAWVDASPNLYVLPPATNTILGGVKPNNGLSVALDGTLDINAGSMFNIDGSGKLELLPGTTTRLGGIKAGPGVVIASDGSLSLDSAGIPFNFGDFYAFTNTGAHDGACLSSINVNQDINIVSNGTGTVNIVGEFNVHRTNSNLEEELGFLPIFKVTADGQVQMLVPKSDLVGGALEIVGNNTGVFFPPDQTGVILHVTGNSAATSRVYFDANQNYALLAGRRYNGPQDNPTRVLAGEVLFRIVGQAAVQATTERASFNTYGPARIEFRATEDQYPTAQGGEVRIFATPNGSVATPTDTLVATFNATTGLTATKFVGPLTGKADTAGNADTVTNGVYTTGDQTIGGTKTFSSTITGSITGNAGTVTNGVVTTGSYSDPSWLTISKSKVGLSAVENTALSTSTHYIGTTSIQYNRASASQTLTGVSIDGNAATVTNGVVTTGSYSDPSWLTISKSKVGLSNVENTALSTSTYYIGTTQNTYNRASGSQTLNGVSIDGNAGTVTNGFYTSSSFNLGTTSIAVNRVSGAQSLTGVSIDGNAGTVTNGVYTNGSYSDPTWLTISKSKVGLSNVENTALSTSTHYIGTTSIQYNRASASQTLTGVSIDGNAATATNGVVTTGSYSDPSWLTISKSKVGLSAVENTALSTWAGTSNITTVGTLTSGTIGSGFTAIDNARLAHSTISGVALGSNLNALTAGTNIAFSSGTTYDGSAAITINFSSTVAVAGNSWTPTLIFATQGSQTYTAQYGNYVKNGRFVTCYFTISTSAQSGTGAMSIGGLPFTSATSTHGPVGNLQVTALTVGGGAGSTDFMGTGTVQSNSTQVAVYGFITAAGGTFAAITGAEYGTGITSISGVIQYITAS